VEQDDGKFVKCISAYKHTLYSTFPIVLRYS